MAENLLAGETSPYLLQHKDNPVDWRPWGRAALDEASRRDVPILLSVGYAACHWCHVMAHESFEDPDTAAVMNSLFVNVKVDREERPDIDQLYMDALHVFGERGGWPLTMFLTPAGEPIWGGTYFPKTSLYGRPAFIDVMQEIARIYRDEPSRIEQNHAAIRQHLMARPADTFYSLDAALIDAVAGKFLSLTDPVDGGLSGAPKFPQLSFLDCLDRAAYRTGDLRYHAALDLTLTKISNGGIYDHVGGGFARYSTDAKWLVPHFEKMLYDNAHLVRLLTDAWRRTKNPLYARRVADTIVWLLRDMKTPTGAFAASLDADSEGEEGKFYVWTRSEVESILHAEAAEFCAAYDITASGNWNGVSIPNRLRAADPDVEPYLDASRLRLLAARNKRIPPSLDDKILADWNGLMIAALAHAATIFARPDWLDAAIAAYRFITESMLDDDRFGHSWREGRLTRPGLSSDSAAMIKAALALYDATFAEAFLADAERWTALIDRHHTHRNGGYYLAADDADDLVIRPFATTDDAMANPNAVMAENLVRLWLLTGNDAYRARADRCFAGLTPDIAADPFATAGLLNALDFRLDPITAIIVGPPSERADLIAAIRNLPTRNVVLFVTESTAHLPPGHPAGNKTANAAAVYLCRGETCSLPITDPNRLAEFFGR